MRFFSALSFIVVLCVAATFGVAPAQESDETPPFPGDMTPSGLAGIVGAGIDSTDTTGVQSVLPEVMAKEVRTWLRETYDVRGGHALTRVLSIPMGPTNVRANNPAGDAIGESQSEVSVAVYGDTVVVGWNDSKGFTAGNTVSSFAYSTDGGATFTDGGNMPILLATDQALGDPGIDTDEQGNWYYNQIYTRGSPVTQQNIGVHHGKFAGGALVWDPPAMASIGTAATGALDKCLIAADRVTGNVYVSYTRFTAVPRIEVVRSTNHGATWDASVLLDNTTTPTSSKQAARPFCGPNGEVYIVWEKGANTINCPDASGNVTNTTGFIAFSKSLDFGLTYSTFQVIGTVDHSWTWSGPGDLRERANEFPDIGVDRSGGPTNGNIYVTWHESAPWTANLTAGPVNAEANDATDNNPGGAQFFSAGQNVTGTISSNADLDYWRFSAVQGQSYLLNLDPVGFNCGVSGTNRGMRMRLFATQSPYPVATAFPDSILAASALGAFAQRIVWTAPKTGDYLVRLQTSTSITVPYTYTLKLRDLTFGAPNPARDARDVVIVRSTNGGVSWSPEQLINDDPAGLENRRPFVCVDGLGHVHVFWHDSRYPGLGSNAALTSIFGTSSRDGGLTWTPNYPVTDELSFFSFNTIAVPNLGDYNMAAAAGSVIHPAWSDQRLSTGDVRNPTPPPTFTAGRGPDTYTTALQFGFSVSCPSDLEVCTFGGSFQRTFTITNTGSIPDSYGWGVTQTGTMTIAPSSGTVGPLAPGASANVVVTVTVPADCSYPSANTLTFTATPVGDADGGQSCTTDIACPVFVSLDLEPNTFNLRSMGNWVTGFIEPPSPFTVGDIDVSSILLEGSVAVDSDAPTAVGDHNGNGIPDLMVKFSRADLELLLSPGDAVTVTVTGSIGGHCFIGSDVIRVIHAPVPHPAQGASIASGRPTSIDWSTPNGVHAETVAILWSMDNGAHWDLTDKDVPNTGQFTWTVPPILTEQAKVAVVLIEATDGGYVVDGVLGTSGTFTVREASGLGDQVHAELALRITSPAASKHGLEVTFSLPEGRPASISLYDVAGRQVATREVGDLGAGMHTTRFGEGTSLPAGIYMVQLIQGEHRVTARAALIH